MPEKIFYSTTKKHILSPWLLSQMDRKEYFSQIDPLYGTPDVSVNGLGMYLFINSQSAAAIKPNIMRGTRGKHINERLRGSREQLQVQEAADANQIGGGGSR